MTFLDGPHVSMLTDVSSCHFGTMICDFLLKSTLVHKYSRKLDTFQLQHIREASKASIRIGRFNQFHDSAHQMKNEAQFCRVLQRNIMMKITGKQKLKIL